MEKHSRKQRAERDPLFDNQDLNAEEREIEAALASGKIKLPSLTQRKRNVERFYRSFGKQKIVKKKPVTIRLDGLTLAVLKDQAHNQGLRYQSLINSVLHRYITGQLVPRK